MTTLLGPKSQSSRSYCFLVGSTLLWFCTYMSTFPFNTQATCWRPEGSTLAIKGGEVPKKEHLSSCKSWTKADGNDPPQFPALHKNDKNQVPRKKAYIKALKRATLHGVTWYRGQYMTASQLGIHTQELLPKTTNLPQPPGHYNKRPSGKFRQCRMSFFSSNIGQLSLAKWDLFRAWLHQQPVDCACLQDTGWNFTGEWQDSTYAYLHSGATKHRGGLLTMVRLGFCQVDNIAWTTPLKSRIQHLRLYMHAYSLDILNLYQHTWNPADPDSGPCRAQFWTSMRNTLKALPRRNGWIFWGDLNTSLQHQTHCVGLSDFATLKGRSRGAKHADVRVLHQLLTDFSLMALNTWKLELGATYKGPRQVASRIDFVLVQQRDGDPKAKQVCYLQNLPQMMGLHEHHFPLLCGIPWRRCYTPTYNTEDWQHFVQHLQQDLPEQLSLSPDLDKLNSTLINACQTFRPTFRPTQDGWNAKWLWALEATTAPTWRPSCTSMMLDIFQGWKWVLDRTRWRKQTRKRAIEHRRGRVQQIINHATYHWASNRTRHYFKMIFKLTPS